MTGNRTHALDTLRTMHAWLRDLFDADRSFLTIRNPDLPRPPRRPGEAVSHHWLRRSNPNLYVGFGVYPARVLLWHARWPILRRCRADQAVGWVVFGLRADGRERVMSWFGTHRLSESLADSYAFHWHRRRVRSKPHRR